MKDLIEGTHFYHNKDGLVVFTRQYHIEKGHCCGNGCLHCPYNYQNINEADRNILLKAREENELY